MIKDDQIQVDLPEIQAKTLQPLTGLQNSTINKNIQCPQNNIKQQHQYEQILQFKLRYEQQKLKDPSYQQYFHQMCFHRNRVGNPQFVKEMKPTKQIKCQHTPFLIGSIILYGGLANLFVGHTETLHSIAILLVTYYIYLILSIDHSNIKGYFQNMRKFDDYKAIFRRLVKNPGYMKMSQSPIYEPIISCNFCASCGRQTKLLPSSEVSPNLFPRVYKDISQGIQNIETLNKFVFVRFRKRFAFSSKISLIGIKLRQQQYLKEAQLCHQRYRYSPRYLINDFDHIIGFCSNGASPTHKILFYLMTALGLSLPYSFIFQHYVSRYDTKIVKLLTY